ncbi:hypothetical protein GBAR_LOCUS30409 [Geodia barretti]|uniref:Uncharacterized protein n=1 Tax=Geodia barretti TaxID=519541 RepID=A0AA35XFQ1_GEOBA|nr:hypothetical protein GBAR_LOCUS30409 [Geodia barretti]
MDQLLTRVLLCACAFALFCQCMTEGDGDGCTRGFMSLDRMDRLLGNIGTRRVADNFQVIFPEVGFTCNGSIQSWVFGAEWVGQNSFFTELQIWRPTGDGAYTKVGYTTINTARSNSELYEYPLSPPLAFQTGDVLGYYQPQPSLSQLSLLLARDGRESQVGYVYSTSSLNINSGFRSSRYQLFVNVVTDPPGCGRGFMSVERMRLFLNLTSVSLPTISPSQRQQISPEMRFTCDGNITKWIIGADHGGNDNLYPELQIWRKAGDETYDKISGTFIETATSVNTRIYEYDNFSPIPVKSGDILGIFIPRHASSRLRLLSENTTSPTQYFMTTDESAAVSPYNVFEIGNQFVGTSSSYHPLVSVEFVRSPTSSVMIISSSSMASTAALHPSSSLASMTSQGPLLVPEPTAEALPISLLASRTFQTLALTAETVPSSSLISTATSPLPTSGAHVPSTEQPSSSSGQSSAAIAAGVGGGVAVALVLLILVLVLVILVVFVKKRKQKGKPQAVEQGKDRNSGSAMDNPVYTGVASGADPTAATISLEELYDLPGRDEGRGDGVYDVPSESGGVYSKVTKTEEPLLHLVNTPNLITHYMRLHN